MDLAVNPLIEKASTLPATFYKDPGMFARCREEVFAKSWQFIGSSDVAKVPGSVYPFTLLEGCLDEPMVLTRDMGDQMHLLSNVCTHRGMAVVRRGRQRAVSALPLSRSPFWPGRQVSIDARVRGRLRLPSDADNLARPPLGQWAQLLFAAVSPIASFEEKPLSVPMIERLSWLPIDQFVLDPSGAREYLVKASWALYVDNYSEGFHIPFIHAALNEALDYENYTCEQYIWSNLQLAVGKEGEECFDLPEKLTPDFRQANLRLLLVALPQHDVQFLSVGALNQRGEASRAGRHQGLLPALRLGRHQAGRRRRKRPRPRGARGRGGG